MILWTFVATTLLWAIIYALLVGKGYNEDNFALMKEQVEGFTGLMLVTAAILALVGLVMWAL